MEGCHTQGETFEETMANIEEAVELYIREVIQRVFVAGMLYLICMES